MSPADELVAFSPVTGAGELGAASDLVLRAFAGRENAKLGRRYVASWLRSLDGDSLLLLARYGDRVLGLAVGTPEHREAARYRGLRAAAVAALLRRPWRTLDPAVVRMAIRRFRGRRETVPEGDCWYLALLATEPAARGEGVGGGLLARFEAEGRRRGWDRGSLHVLRGSHAARRFYEEAGWQPLAPSWPGRVRYEKPLSVDWIPRSR